MTDIIDAACELEEKHREEALARQRARAVRPTAGSYACVDCGDAIPKKRRMAIAGCTRCIECERIAEARRKTTRR